MRTFGTLFEKQDSNDEEDLRKHSDILRYKIYYLKEKRNNDKWNNDKWQKSKFWN